MGERAAMNRISNRLWIDWYQAPTTVLHIQKKVDLRFVRFLTRSNDMNRFDLLKPLKICFHAFMSETYYFNACYLLNTLTPQKLMRNCQKFELGSY